MRLWLFALQFKPPCLLASKALVSESSFRDPESNFPALSWARPGQLGPAWASPGLLKNTQNLDTPETAKKRKNGAQGVPKHLQNGARKEPRGRYAETLILLTGVVLYEV